ncbi:MAG: aldo/keto reductase [Candidatus Hydrogenedentes bacterium]|jgi:predicted aldo/keto reductase-like oxidoreductase|nr:aldo/keto reductase [Candidatus Hydrogenedentota bacterium]
MKRRSFINTVAGSAAILLSSSCSRSRPATTTLAQRPLGKTGLKLSTIGFSGLVARNRDPESVERVVHESLEQGVNFFDGAASYGNTEEKLAPVLRPLRDKIILSSKTRERAAEEAEKDFAQSCSIYHTDYFDLYLIHGIQDVEKDVNAAFNPGGVMDWALKKKEQGDIRFLGFSAHSTEAALAAMERYTFDFFYFPVSYVPALKAGFGPNVLQYAHEKELPCIALKAMARQKWSEENPQPAEHPGRWYEPIEEAGEARLALRWTFSQQGVVSMLPPGEEGCYRLALSLAHDLPPITPQETKTLERMAEPMHPLFPRI